MGITIMKNNGLYSLNKQIKSITFALFTGTLLCCTPVMADQTQETSATEKATQAASELLNVRISELALQQQKGRILSIDEQEDALPNCYRVKILSKQGKIHILDNICES